MKRTSLARIEANRKNGALSQGPKTLAGKQKSSRNSIKHGLLSSAVVVHEAYESEESFNELLTALRDDFHPVGQMEHLLVERIAVCVWRLRRALRVESAQIGSLVVNELGYAAGVPTGRYIKRQFSGFMNPMATDLSDTVAYERDAVKEKLRILREVQNKIDAGQRLNRADISPYHTYMAKPPLVKRTDSQFKRDDRIYQALEGFVCFQEPWDEVKDSINEDLSEDDGEPIWTQAEYEAMLNETRTEMLAAVEKGIADYAYIVELMDKQGDTVVDTALHQLPTEDTLNRLTRYETTIERQMYRAITELERLQHRRKGEVSAMLFFALLDFKQHSGREDTVFCETNPKVKS